MLEHLVPGNHNVALAGDLLEEFQSGRSRGWYWKQVLAAITTGHRKEIRERLLLLIFAFVWAAPVPYWWAFIFKSYLPSSAWGLPWPYSTILNGIPPVFVFAYVWAGLAVYLQIFSIAKQTRSLEKTLRGFWIGPVMYIIATVSTRALFHDFFVSGRLQCALSLIVAAWGVKVRCRQQPERLSA
jgi:hypothetical protein